MCCKMPPMNQDIMSRYVSDAGLALSMVRCSSVCKEIGQDQHGLRGSALRCVAEAVCNALLLSTRMKGRGLLSWSVSGSGAIPQLRVDAIGLGQVRAMIAADFHEAVEQWDGLGEPFGPGRLSVSRQIEGQDQPYTSRLEVESGSPDSYSRFLLRQSDQVQGNIWSDVLLNDEGEIESVVAFYLEFLPGNHADTEADSVARIRGQHLIYDEFDVQNIASYASNEDIIAALFSGAQPFQKLRDYPVSFYCPCTRERYRDTLSGFSTEELEKLTEDRCIHVVCDFCRKRYDIALSELEGEVS